MTSSQSSKFALEMTAEDKKRQAKTDLVQRIMSVALIFLCMILVGLLMASPERYAELTSFIPAGINPGILLGSLIFALVWTKVILSRE